MISRIANHARMFFLAAIASTLTVAAAQTTPSVQVSPSPIDLVRTTVTSEIEAANDHSVKHMFRDYKKTPQGSQTRIYVETNQAMAGMTVAYNDKPLSGEQLQVEEGRLAGLAGNPEQLSRKERQEKEEANRTLSIVRALPEAFLFEDDGTEPGTATVGREGGELVRLKFRPNPAYRPPSHTEEVLVGMAGFLLIDPAAHRIARIDGTLFKEVNFGWGILGHLNKGGRFFVEQEDLGDGSWDVSCMRLDFAGKILLFKNIAIKSDEIFSNFHRVPPGTSFAQGVEMLKSEQAKLAQGGAETTRAENRSH